MHRTDDRTGVGRLASRAVLDPAAPVEAWQPCECGRPVCPDRSPAEPSAGPIAEAPVSRAIPALVRRLEEPARRVR
ncbi:hypothetical protein ACWDR0_27415 [Streptomyces sp. NPDC003691]